MKDGDKKRVVKKKIVKKTVGGKEEIEITEETPTEGVIVEEETGLIPTIEGVVATTIEDFPDEVKITEVETITTDDKGRVNVARKRVVKRKEDGKVDTSVFDEGITPTKVLKKKDMKKPIREVQITELSDSDTSDRNLHPGLISFQEVFDESYLKGFQPSFVEEASDDITCTTTESVTHISGNGDKTITRKKIIKSVKDGKEEVQVIHDFPVHEVTIEEIAGENSSNDEIQGKPGTFTTTDTEIIYKDHEGNTRRKHRKTIKSLVDGKENVVVLSETPEEGLILPFQEPLDNTTETLSFNDVDYTLPIVQDVSDIKELSPRSSPIQEKKGENYIVTDLEVSVAPTSEHTTITYTNTEENITPLNEFLNQSDSLTPTMVPFDSTLVNSSSPVSEVSSTGSVVETIKDKVSAVVGEIESVPFNNVEEFTYLPQHESARKILPTQQSIEITHIQPLEVGDEPQKSQDEQKINFETYGTHMLQPTSKEEESHETVTDTGICYEPIHISETQPEQSVTTEIVSVMPISDTADKKILALKSPHDTVSEVLTEQNVTSTLTEDSLQQTKTVKPQKVITEPTVEHPNEAKTQKEQGNLIITDTLEHSILTDVNSGLIPGEIVMQPTPSKKQALPSQENSLIVQVVQPMLTEDSFDTPTHVTTAAKQTDLPKHDSEAIVTQVEVVEDRKEKDDTKKLKKKKKLVDTVKDKEVVEEQTITEADNETAIKIPQKLKLEKLEVKEIKPTKLKIVDQSNEVPQFAKIKLKKTTVTPKKDTPQTVQLPKVLLKSLIKRINYPPQENHITITAIDVVVDNGILSRNYEEALKIKKKKIKKVKLPEIEKEDLERYSPTKIESEDVTEDNKELKEKFQRKPEKMQEKDVESKQIIIGKGKVPEKENESESVVLKKIPAKSKEETDEILLKPKKIKQEEQIEKPVEISDVFELAPLPDIDTNEGIKEDLLEKSAEEILGEEGITTKPLKKIKKKPSKPDISDEDKKLKLGKGKDKPIDDETDILLKKKQGELPKEEPEKIVLKPFETDKPESEKDSIQLTLGKPIFPETKTDTEKVQPTEVQTDDSKSSKKIVKKKRDIPKAEKENEINQPTILPEVNEPQTVERIEIKKQKPKLVKVEDIKHEEPLFASVKLRKASVTPKKEIKEQEVKKVLLKSLIKIVPFPVEEKKPIITVMKKIIVQNGILSRNYKEAEKIQKQKPKKVKLPKKEEPDLEVYVPHSDEIKEKEVSEENEMKISKIPTNKPDIDESQPLELKIGKGKIPEEKVEEEIVVLKKIPKHTEDEKQYNIENNITKDSEIIKEVTEDTKDSDNLGPLKDLDFVEKTKSDILDEVEVKEKEEDSPIKESDKKIKLQPEKPTDTIEDKVILLGKPKKEQSPEDVPFSLIKPVPSKEENDSSDKVVLKPFSKNKEIEEEEQKLDKPIEHIEETKKPDKKLSKKKKKPVEETVADEVEKDETPLQVIQDSEEVRVIEDIPEDIPTSNEKPLTEEKLKPKLEKLERKEIKRTKMKVEELQPIELLSAVKLKKTTVKKDKKITEEKPQRILLKSRIIRIVFPTEEQTAVISVMKPVVKDCGVLSRNYSEAEKVLKKKQKKVKLPKKEDTDLELYKPHVDDEEKAISQTEESVKIEKKVSKGEEIEPEELTLKIGKGEIPENESQDETVILKKIPDKSKQSVPSEEKEEQFTFKQVTPTPVIEDDVTEEIILRKEIPENIVEESTEQVIVRKKKPEIPTEEEIVEKVTIKKDSPDKIEEITIEEITVKKKKPKKPTTVEDIEQELIVKNEKPEAEEIITEDIVIKKKKSPIVESQEEDSTIKIEKPKEAEEVTSEEVVIKKKKPKKAPVMEEAAEEIIIKKGKPVEKEVVEESIQEDIVIKKKTKKPPVVEEEADNITIKTEKPKQVEELTTEEITVKQEKPKIAPVVEEVAEEITIKKETPVEEKVVEEEKPEDIVIKKKKSAVVEEEADSFTIKTEKPMQVEEIITEEITVKKKKPKKTPAAEEVAEEITIKREKSVEKEVTEEVIQEDVVIKKKKISPVIEEVDDVTVNIEKPKQVEEIITEEITVKKKKPKKDSVVEEVTEEITIKKEKPEEKEHDEEVITEEIVVKKKKHKKIPIVENVTEEVTIKKQKPHVKKGIDEEATELLVVKKKKPTIPAVEDISEEITITKNIPEEKGTIEEEISEEIVVEKEESPDVEEQGDSFKIKIEKPTQVEEITAKATTVKKKKSKKAPVVEEAAEEITVKKEITVEKDVIEEEIQQDIVIKKKTPVNEEEVDNVTIKTEKPIQIEEITAEEITVKKKKPKKDLVVEEAAEEITIKKEIPVEKEVEEVKEEVTLKKKKPKKGYVVEEVSEDIVLQKEKPMKTEEVSAENVTVQKKKKPKIPITEDIADEITVVKEEPISEDIVETDKPSQIEIVDDDVSDVVVEKEEPVESFQESATEVTIKPSNKTSRKPSYEEHSEEVTLKQKKHIEPEEEKVENVTFKPRVTKTKEEVEQEFKIQLQDYEEEEITMSGKVRLPRKKKSISIPEDASAEMTIEREVEIQGPEDINLTLKRKTPASTYNVEDVEEEDVQVGLRQEQHRGSVIYEEESLDIKVKRKPSKPTIPAFHQEATSLSVTKEVESDLYLQESVVHEGDVLFSICSYVAENEDALNLVEGEKVYILDNSSQDWWFVRKHLTEEKGWVPAIYLRDEPSYTLYVQKKLHEKIDKLPIFEKPGPGEDVFAPRFVEKLQPKHVPDGATVQFECQVEGNPRPQITWFRQTAIIKPSQDFQIFYDDDNVATLIIREVFPEDAGTFTCVAKNAAGFASSTTELNVDAPLSDHGSDITGLSRKSLSRESSLADILEGIPPTFSRKPKAKVVDQGTDVELECRLVAVPEPEVTWLFKDKEVKQSDSVTVTTQSDMHMYNTMIRIKKVKKSQEGTYTVIAKNREGQATLNIILKVKTGEQEPPQILEPLQDITIIEGESAVLSTQITANPTPTVVWLKDGKPEPKLPTTVQDDTYTLTLIKPAPGDSARFTVMATNKLGTAQTGSTLIVEEFQGPQAPLFIERFEEQNVKEKNTIRLVAKVTGNPVPTVTWFRNNRILLESPKKKEVFDGENIILEISNADSEEDAGDYKCVASNTVGTATHGARITVDVEKVSFTKELHKHVEGRESDTITLECETSHTVSTKWQHNGVELTGMDHRELVQEGRIHKLVIKKATPLDAGIYTCSVKDQITTSNVVIQELKPDFIRKLEDFEVKEQEIAILEVEVSSEFADVTWHKDGETLELKPGKLEMEKKGNIRKLLIRGTSVHDEGEYTCSLGDQECTAEVTVIELPPEISTKLQDITVTKGEKATLEVELTKGDALVRWFKDDKELHFSEHVQLSIDGKKQKLKIYQAELSDAGVYCCKVGDQTSTARVTVEKPAVDIVTTLPEVTLVPLNTDAEFLIELSHPDVDVKWLKKGKEIKSSKRHIITAEGTIRKLIIKNATVEDQAEYSCVAMNVKVSTKLKTEIIETVPKIVVDTKEYRVKKGEDVTLEVKFTATPPPQAEWTVNGTVVQKSKKTIPAITEESASLTIKKVEDGDIGNYTLRLKNPVGEASAELTLIIMQLPGEPGVPDVVETTDDSVTLYWKPPESDGNSPIKEYIIEYHDKEEFMTWHEVKETIVETTHKITKLTKNTEIMFRVSAVNEVGKGPASHNTRYVKIATPVAAEAPVVQEPLKDVSAALKSTITLQCVIGGTPTPEIKWFKNGKAVKSKTITYENCVAKYTITECTESMTGTYSCKAINTAGTAETSCQLTIQDIPKIDVDESIINQRLRVLSQWKPEIKFSGYPQPEITWRKNGSVIESTKKCTIFVDETTSTIAIYSVERSDSGSYVVTARNSAGSASAELTLRVTDKPGKPEGPITFKDISATAITVEWKPPMDDGGIELTAYILEKYDVAKMVWTKVADVESDTTSYKVERLQEDCDYMFRVYAQNPLGTSEALESKRVTAKPTYNKPSPPQGPLELSGMSETICTIKWHIPENDGGSPILDYTVERKESNKKAWQKVGTTSDLYITVSDMKTEMSYDFRITARNIVGSSAPYYSEEPVVAGRRITPPSAPTNFTTAEITSKSVTLKWGPPEYTGGTELTGYVIEYKLALSNKWIKVVTLDASVNQYCVENLKEKSELYFRIYAENSLGLSTPACSSLISLQTHATVPSPPTAPLEIRSIGANTVIIEWGVPESDGGAPLEGYNVAIRDVKKTMWMEVGRVKSDVQKLTLKDLQENHEYLIRIFARNEVGLSEPLESDEPFLVKKPTGEEELDVEEMSGLEKETPSLSLTTETTTVSWMREAGMDADIHSYARGSLLRRSEYFFRIWYYARSLFK